MTPDEQNRAYEQEVRRLLGDAAYERIQKDLQDGLARIEAHYAEVARQRKRELRYVLAWWTFWAVIIVANILVWHNDTVHDMALFANCIVMAKAVYDVWRIRTGRYPPRMPE